MAARIYKTIDKYIVNAICTAPLHIGSAIGDKGEVLVHPITGLPFIQSSSIAGLLRSVSEKVNDTESNDHEVTKKLFGDIRPNSESSGNDFSSAVRITDGTFENGSVHMELRPRVAINQETGSVNSSKVSGTDKSAGHKFEMESIGAGAKFSFEVFLFDSDMKDELEAVFSELKAEHLQVGGQKSNGEGFIALDSLLYRRFDMTSAAERQKWAQEAELPVSEYKKMQDDLEESKGGTCSFIIKAYGYTEGSLLIKAIAVTEYGKDAPDAKNIRNAAKEYIIPGSSLKGTLKNQAASIAEYLGKEYLIDQIFGKTGKKNESGTAGCVSVKDTIIGTKEDNDKADIQHHIHIDKFTGGVMNQGLFSDQNVCGKLQMEIRITAADEDKAAAGLMILALRDMASGLMNVGSGYSTGKGFIRIDRIELCSCAVGTTAAVDLKNNKIDDADGMINTCLKAVEKAERKGTK